LQWPHSSCHVRVVEVSNRVHQRYEHSDGLQLFQMIAKNVGIRRAKGRFVLATNLDVILSDELAAFLASRLDPLCFYRVDRYDVNEHVPLDTSLDERLKYCKENVIRVNRRSGTYEYDWFFCHGLGRAKRAASRVSRLLRAIYAGMTPRRIRRAYRNLREGRTPYGPRRFVKYVRSVIAGIWLPYPRLFTNACGDFTLLSREKWWALRGYPELPIFSFHLDSVFLHMAYQSGLKEAVLDREARLYHIEHSSGWTPAGEQKMYTTLRETGVPFLTFAEFRKLAAQMQKARRPLILNGEDWGLSEEKLKELDVR